MWNVTVQLAQWKSTNKIVAVFRNAFFSRKTVGAFLSRMRGTATIRALHPNFAKKLLSAVTQLPLYKGTESVTRLRSKHRFDYHRRMTSQ